MSGMVWNIIVYGMVQHDIVYGMAQHGAVWYLHLMVEYIYCMVYMYIWYGLAVHHTSPGLVLV